MDRTWCRRVASVVGVGVVSTMIWVAPRASAAAWCAGPAAGGDWPSYGHDLSNTRNQPGEQTIGTDNVGSLRAAWTFLAPTTAGGFQSTPVVAEGCVYATTANGYIFALNADTGELVWGGQYAKAPVAGVCCGGTMFAVTVLDGVLYVHVAENPTTSPGGGPHALAVDAHTGAVIWNSGPLATEDGAYTNSSPVIFNGMDFFGISGPEENPSRPGGFAIIDIETGGVLKRTYTIPQDDYDRGYGGGSIWSTAAVDLANGFAYAGTGQPASATLEHEHTNAILKVDVDPGRPTFGEIVDAYKASPDSTLEVLRQQRTCQQGQAKLPLLSEALCFQNDVDFAASPTLYRDSRGKTMVAEFQKSGILHAAFATTMEKAWEARLAVTPGYLGNYASTATDGRSVFGAGAYPGQLWSVDKDRGGYNWVAPVGTTWSANPVAYANGVVYHSDGKGLLNAFDALTGIQLLAHPMASDLGVNPCTNQGGGVAIARNTVYAACGEGLQSAGNFGNGDPNNGPFVGAIIAYKNGG